MPYKRIRNGKTRWVGKVERNGRKAEKVFDTRREAKDWEADAGKRAARKQTPTVSLHEWSTQYLGFVQLKHTRKTYLEKVAVLRRLLLHLPPTTPAEKLTPGAVLAFLQDEVREGRSGHSVNKDRKNLVAAWNWGIKYLGLPARNPCLVDRFPEQSKPRYVPPLEDFLKVLETVEDDQDRIMLLTFLHLGARRGEVFRLKWADLDFKKSTVTLYTRKRKDGSEEYDTLFMTQELKRHLLWWWENRPIKTAEHVFICLVQTPFCGDYYGKPFEKRNHLMKRLCERAGVKPFGFHAIRHLTASYLDRQGVELRMIQGILRHKSATTTARYLHTLRGAGEVLDGIMPKMPGKVICLEEKRAAVNG